MHSRSIYKYDIPASSKGGMFLLDDDDPSELSIAGCPRNRTQLKSTSCPKLAKQLAKKLITSLALAKLLPVTALASNPVV